ncbi:hypothetical protein CEXT_147291 [Caerostris extrusa]|uniref:Uncharacterized protein n=1 Tax=Caerostris extrusa TaxID=172846 RepID=A0AAV4T2G6_CAEEX|nr:hypothetical protein CEXT_147291 [Caerostris extrusa]
MKKRKEAHVPVLPPSLLEIRGVPHSVQAFQLPRGREKTHGQVHAQGRRRWEPPQEGLSHRRRSFQLEHGMMSGSSNIFECSVDRKQITILLMGTSQSLLNVWALLFFSRNELLRDLLEQFGHFFSSPGMLGQFGH